MACGEQAGGLTSFGMGLNPSDFVVCPWALAYTDAPQLSKHNMDVERRGTKQLGCLQLMQGQVNQLL